MANWRKAIEKGTVLFYDDENDTYLANAPIELLTFDDLEGSFEIERVKASPKKLANRLEEIEASYQDVSDFEAPVDED